MSFTKRTIYCCRQCKGNTYDRSSVLQPCVCIGPKQWIHYSCLDEWRAKQKKSTTFCPECKLSFTLLPLSEEDLSSIQQVYLRRMKCALYLFIVMCSFGAFCMLWTCPNHYEWCAPTFWNFILWTIAGIPSIIGVLSLFFVSCIQVNPSMLMYILTPPLRFDIGDYASLFFVTLIGYLCISAYALVLYDNAYKWELMLKQQVLDRNARLCA